MTKWKKTLLAEVPGRQHLSKVRPLLKTQLPLNLNSPNSNRRKSEKEGDVVGERGEADKVEKDSFGSDFHSLGFHPRHQPAAICHLSSSSSASIIDMCLRHGRESWGEVTICAYVIVPMVDKDGGAEINQVCLVGVSTSWQVACRPILKTQKTMMMICCGCC